MNRDVACSARGSARNIAAGLLSHAQRASLPNPFSATSADAIFFNGLWACCDPKCPAVAPSDSLGVSKGRTVGKLYASPRLVCDCGARVLDVLVCQSCGEIYFGGYRRDDAGTVWYMISQSSKRLPILRWCRIARSGRAVFWPAPNPDDDPPMTATWQHNNRRCRWSKARLDVGTGELQRVARGEPNGLAVSVRTRHK